MKNFIYLSFFAFLMNFQLPAQQMQEVGSIRNDTIYYSDTVLINQDIFIGSNQTLIIAPGSFLEFQGHYQIKVNGIVKAIGSISDSIIFTIADTTLFSDTSTVAGGWKGINFWDRNDVDTSIFKYCRFEYGKSVSNSNANKNGKGGALYINNYSNILISNCTFNNNLSKTEGGGVYSCETPIIINDNTFVYNRTFLSGGGIRIIFENTRDNILSNINDVIIISNNFFQYNIAYQSHLGLTGGDGGAISLATTFSLVNVKVINNKLFNNKSMTILYESCYYHTIENNIICNNYGIGYWNGHSATHGNFFNNIVCNNYGLTFTGGLVINSYSNNFKIKNNIIWCNVGYFYWEDTLQIGFEGHGTGFTIDYNCLNYGHNGEGNIESPPMFVNPTAGTGLDYNGADADWSLLDNSPCINTGTPDTTGLYLPEFDIAGNPRIYGNRIDMGAYENQIVWVKINDSPVFNKSVKVYPNPGKEKLFIELQPGMEGAWLDLVDGTGKRLIHSQITTIPAILSPTGLKPGIYYYRIYNHDQVFKKGKWVKL